jgi:type II secretory pathway pseudopilin PulG
MHRKGFTLLDLIVAIAIIIILAAIAIPSYLKMMDKARRSAVVAEFANLATVLETFNTDWGHYPLTAGGPEAIASNGSVVFKELTTEGSGIAVTNVAGARTAHDDPAPIVYIGAAALTSMTNPFVRSLAGPQYTYDSDTDGRRWLLYVCMGEDADDRYLVRRDGSSTVTESATQPTL